MSSNKKLPRRSFLEIVAGSLFTVTGGLAGSKKAYSQITDSDANDESGRGRGGNGITDNDANDETNRGRGGNGITDNDVNDESGRGRG